MNNRVRNTIIVGFGFLAAGLILWPIPYNKVSMLSSPYLWEWAIAGAAAGLMGRLTMRQPIVLIASMIAVGFCCATLVRVIFETIIDPTSHNLWPFEIGIAVFIGFPSGLLGALLGWKARPVQ